LGCPDGVGRFNHFRALHIAGTPDSSIYWSPASGAHELYGAIRDKWARLAGSAASRTTQWMPKTTRVAAACKFQRAVITWSAEGGAAEHEGSGESMTFESGPVTSSLPLGGNIHLVVRRNGDFVFSGHAHGSGFDNIDYAFAVLLATAGGTAYTFAHAGHVEGTIAGLPFGKPNRESDFTITGNVPAIAADWKNILQSGRILPPKPTGKDKLMGALEDLLADAAKQIGAAAIKAAVTALAA